MPEDDQFEMLDDGISDSMSDLMDDSMSMTDAESDIEFHGDGLERSTSFQAGVIAAQGTLNNQINAWSANWNTREVDLITELGASSLFFISADSLVLEFLMNGDAKISDELQVLHVHYLLELLLYY